MANTMCFDESYYSTQVCYRMYNGGLDISSIIECATRQQSGNQSQMTSSRSHPSGFCNRMSFVGCGRLSSLYMLTYGFGSFF